MDYLENSIFKSKAVVFDQLSFWLVMGVFVIFLAGAAFGRMTDEQSQASITNSPPAIVAAQHAHHAVYGRFGSLHWAN